MCGINIIISTTNFPEKEPLLAMQKATLNRGPDASEIFIYEKEGWHLGIGVNRLHVVDNNDQSNQPMISLCGNYVLAYNGEVYNYQDLKNQLISKGYQFKTPSDTEVVLYWLQEFGGVGLSAFKGMFALVFIDLRKKEVTIGRDRHGIKPLFYFQTAERLIISSSILAIESSGLANLSINNNAIDDYLAYRHVMGYHTFYTEVKSHEPGVITQYDERLLAKNIILKQPSPSTEVNLGNILIETTSLVVEAPASPGLMLSGGVDSTLILAIINKDLAIRGIDTYTLDTGEDSPWAKLASKQYESRHHEIPVSVDVLQRLDEFLFNTDQPIADHGAFAAWLVAEEANKNSNILLSGAGADELFGGYNRHRAYQYYLKHQHLVLAFKKVIDKLNIKGLLPKGWQQFIKGVDQDPVSTYRKFLQNYAIKEITDDSKFWQSENIITNNLIGALDFDKRNYLVADVLAITDNALMQKSVEGRVPFLYDDVVNFANHISIEDKMKSRGKDPLKELLIKYNGLKYAKRTKQGFGLPLATWLRDKKSEWLWDFIHRDSPLFMYCSKTTVLQLLQQHRSGKTDNSMQLWSILVLEKWLSRIH